MPRTPEQARKYREDFKAKLSADPALLAEFKAKKKAADKAYYLANKEKCNAQSKAYRETHREEMLLQQKQYYKDTPLTEEKKSRRNAANLRWYHRNREKRMAQHAEWVSKNKEQQLAYSKQYESSHREERREKSKKFHRQNPEKSRAISRAYHAKNKDRNNTRAKVWKKANPEACLTYAHRRRALINGSVEHHTPTDWRRILAEHGHKCTYCGIKESPDNKLTRDHYFPLSRGGSNAANNIVPACGDCNRRKQNKDPLDFIRSIGLLL